jgi:hypothetical protein
MELNDETLEVIAQIIVSQFERIHDRSPRTTEEVDLWLETYTDTEEGDQLVREITNIAFPGITDKQLAEKARLEEAQRLLDLFKEAHQRPAHAVDELATWIASPEGKEWLALDHQDPVTDQDSSQCSHRRAIRQRSS